MAFRDDQRCCASWQDYQVGRRIDESTPMVDARLSGSRVNAIIRPWQWTGLHPFHPPAFRPTSWCPRSGGRKALTRGMMELLEAAVKARLNIIIAGGTGSGKTTLLMRFQPSSTAKGRIVTIEDAAELQLKQPRVVRLKRAPNLKEMARCASANCWSTASVCGPTGLWWAKSAVRKRWTCCRP